tara:strand:+ start:3860 stop:4672 length:813 start_codon:yes stop_codon:yes gene_type:complete
MNATVGGGRIRQCFEEVRVQGKKALISFITAGDPGVDYTVPAMHSLVQGGVDILELGIPFSDPEAEGPTIQAANERALENGMTLLQVLEMVAEFRKKNTETPVVLMGYLNSILAMSDFPSRASSAGVDGLIMVNLPPEEGATLQSALADHGMDLIYLIAPTTTPARTLSILQQASGFVYCVSLKGTTGAGHVQAEEVIARTAELQQIAELPIAVGFGIKDAQTARALSANADGIVVGSALVNLMTEPQGPEVVCQRLHAAVASIRQGLDD